MAVETELKLRVPLRHFRALASGRMADGKVGIRSESAI